MDSHAAVFRSGGAPLPRLGVQPVYALCVSRCVMGRKADVFVRKWRVPPTGFARSGRWVKMQQAGTESTLESHEGKRLRVARYTDGPQSTH